MSLEIEMKPENVILSFEGIIDSDKIEHILVDAENVISKTDSDPSIKKRVYTILVEFLQNLYHHAESDQLEETDSKEVAINLLIDEFNYYIITRNYIRNSNIQPLKDWIDEINSLTASEVKKSYLEVLQNSEFSEKGGANLGIIDIVRKSKNPLQYSFIDVNDIVSYFEAKATIRHKKLNPFHKGKTKYTPEISFDNHTGLLRIDGRSFPEDPSSFYVPVINWLDIYVLQSAPITTMEVFLEFFNTSSSKYFLEIFKRLKRIEDFGNKAVNVKWFYEKDDDDMYETGIDYKDISNLTFKIIEK